MSLEEILLADVQKQLEATLVKKWDKTGLLEQLSDAAKGKMALLLENQGRRIQHAASTDVDFFQHNALPMVRGMFASLAESAEGYVMNLPSQVINNKVFVVRERRFDLSTPVALNINHDLVCCGLSAEAELCWEIMDQLKPMLEGTLVMYIPFQEFVIEDGKLVAIISRVGEPVESSV